METTKKCACSGANLGKFIQPIILNILRGEPVNGYQLIKKMETYATFIDCKPDPTGVYRYLKAMEEKSLIVKTDEDYAITSEGMGCYNNWKSTLKSYVCQIEKLLVELES